MTRFGLGTRLPSTGYRPKGFQNGNFVAALELRAAQAILPNLERKFAALDFLKTHLTKKIRLHR